ncbi:hypothetical protein P8452_55478 [Trifolium repens]|nr:hypothetical protein P8452_55478 [Trifolium repens]
MHLWEDSCIIIKKRKIFCLVFCSTIFNIYSIRNPHSHPLLFSSFSLRFVTPSTTNPYSIPFETLTLFATDRRHQTVSAAVSTLPCRRIHLPPTGSSLAPDFFSGTMKILML